MWNVYDVSQKIIHVYEYQENEYQEMNIKKSTTGPYQKLYDDYLKLIK